MKRPPAGCLLHERRNGRFVLQVTGHPSYGLPWGQDRLVPIFLATMAVRQKSARITFNSAAEMLDTFGIQQGGSQYRRLVASFQRIFGATIFFGTDIQKDRAAVVHCARFNCEVSASLRNKISDPVCRGVSLGLTSSSRSCSELSAGDRPIVNAPLRLYDKFGTIAMARPDQLQLLKQGVAAWNNWRMELRDLKVDLSGADLSGMDQLRPEPCEPTARAAFRN